MKDVCYAGSKSQWDSLKKNIWAYNAPLLNATLHYNSVAPGTSVTVTFNATGGTTPTKTKGKTYSTLPTPTRQGCHFIGWYTTKSTTGGTKVTTTKKVTLSGKQTLYARWSKDAVKVTSVMSGSWRVTPPKGWYVRLYATSTTATYKASYLGNGTGYLTCTRKATLTNGTTRYYTKYNGKNYWFTYTAEMTVK